MKTNEAGLQIIRDSEGLRLKAYRCSAGVWTIGWGHAGPDVNAKSVITEEMAERLLAQDVATAERAVLRHVRVPLNPNQFSALVSFVFNVGANRFSQSTMQRLLNKGDYMGAAGEFPKWRIAGGSVSKGLVKRRERERALFLKPVLVK